MSRKPAYQLADIGVGAFEYFAGGEGESEKALDNLFLSGSYVPVLF
jgi:hypothetical protein